MSVITDPNQPQPRRVINLKAVVICGIVIAVVSQGLQRLHSRQVAETTSFLRKAAKDTVLHGQPHDAIQALERYLAFSNDPDARETLSRLLTEHGTDPDTLRTAYAINEGLLLDDADNSELRLRQTELAVRLQLFSDADSHLRTLRSRLPDSGQVWYLSGLIAQQAEQPAEAVACYEKAIELNSDEPDCYARLVSLQESDGIALAESERRFDRLITLHPSADAYRVQADWLLKANRIQDAVAALWKGIELSPHDLRLNSRLVSTLQATDVQDPTGGDSEQQRLVGHLQQQVTDHPTDPRLRLLCVHALWNTGQREAAVGILKDGIARNPQAFELQEVLVDYLVSRGDSQQASAVLRRLPRAALSHARRHFLEGRVLMARQEWAEAAVSFEKASGFAESDVRIRHRAGLALAVCRRELGERDDALETYRSMIHARPDSQDSRLGMAATWLEAGRMDLAIAEYRQLQDVPGVPELLTSLLIRETLRQPVTLRDWSEAEELLRAKDPTIKDPSQRLLLQADLLFAQGHPAQALRLLDGAVIESPKNAAFIASRRRVLSDSDGILKRKLDDTLTSQPDSLEAHITRLRLLAHQQGYETAVSATRDLTNGRAYRQLTDRQRCETAARAAEIVATDLQAFENPAGASALLDEAESAWKQLSALFPETAPQRLAFVARHRSHQSVLQMLNSLSGSVDADILTQACLAALANTTHKTELKEAVERMLRHSIVDDPANLRLRQAYAEYLLQFAEYDQALSIERQILQYEPRNAAAMSRGAWILTMSDGDHAEALSLSESASRYAPDNSEVRIVRGLVLAHSDAPDDALPVFRSVPNNVRSAESFAYEALALLRAGQPEKAAESAREARRRLAPERWKPADRRLLQDVLNQIAGADVAGR